MAQLLCKTERRFLTKLKIEPPHDAATPLLGIYPKEVKALRGHNCTSTVFPLKIRNLNLNIQETPEKPKMRDRL